MDTPQDDRSKLGAMAKGKWIMSNRPGSRWMRRRFSKRRMEKIVIADMKRCADCGKPFVEVVDDIAGKKTGHLFTPTCNHFFKGIIVSIG